MSNNRRCGGAPKALAMMLCAAALPVAVACASTSTPVQAALHGDLATLRSAISDAKAAGELDQEMVGALARAVAQREVFSAKGEAALRRLRTVRSCAAPLFGVLEQRAERLDEAGAEAALILLEQNRVGRASAIKSHRDNASGAWRALAARASTDPEYALLRREYFGDPDERVRRGAFEAALIARDAYDAPGLLDAARLDPDALARSLATRALGAVGGEDIVLRLRDRWERAEETVRLTIIEAWAMPAAFKAGGERELLRIAEQTQGTLAISAAHALYRLSETHRDTGVAVLGRAISDGTRTERRLALQLAEYREVILREAIKKAAKDSDEYVQLMAYARLLGDPKEAPAARTALRKIAAGKEPSATQAQAALAAAGDSAIEPALLKALTDKNSATRKSAGRGLIRLGQVSKVAPLLADNDPDVRTSIACSLIARNSLR